MKKNVLTLGLITASAVALGGYSYAAQSDITTTTDSSTTTQTVAAWKTKILGKKLAKIGKGQEAGGFGKEGGFGGKGGFGMDGHGMKQDAATEAALKANDYNAFVTAFNANTNKPTDATVPTQEQFNKMVQHYTKNAAREAAIEANDYNAFVTATTPTQEEFAGIVAQHASQKAIQTAITNKDYTAFVAALKADTKRPADAKVPTQEEFNNMVTRQAQ